MTGAPHTAAAARPVVPLRHGAAAAPAELGEGPVWDSERRELIWVDIDRGLVHRRARAARTLTLGAGQPVGCAVPRAGGGLALGVRDGFALVEPDGGEARLVAPVERERAGHPNERRRLRRARPPLGRHDVAARRHAAAGLYRLEPDLTVTRGAAGAVGVERHRLVARRATRSTTSTRPGAGSTCTTSTTQPGRSRAGAP